MGNQKSPGGQTHPGGREHLRRLNPPFPTLRRTRFPACSHHAASKEISSCHSIGHLMFTSVFCRVSQFAFTPAYQSTVQWLTRSTISTDHPALTSTLRPPAFRRRAIWIELPGFIRLTRRRIRLSSNDPRFVARFPAPAAGRAFQMGFHEAVGSKIRINVAYF